MLWDFNNENTFTVWQGLDAKKFTFNTKGDRFAFVSEIQLSEGTIFQLWYYKDGLDVAFNLPVTPNDLFNIGSNHVSNMYPEFSRDDK